MDEEQNSKTGYKKPPRHTRFQPGRSGNPRGRPKKRGATFAESLESELYTSITVIEGGKRQRITKLHAIVKQQTSKALSGDPKATALVISVLERRAQDGHDRHRGVDSGREVDHGQV